MLLRLQPLNQPLETEEGTDPIHTRGKIFYTWEIVEKLFSIFGLNIILILPTWLIQQSVSLHGTARGPQSCQNDNFKKL